MRDDEQGAVLEAVADAALDEGVGGEVDARGCFVHDDDFLAGQEGAGEAEELALAEGEVVAAKGDGGGEGEEGGFVELW